MKSPSNKQHYSVVVHHGRYVSAQLRQMGYGEYADAVATSTLEVQQSGRAMEDSRGFILESIAHRDLAEDYLKETARVLRLRLAARSADAISQAPYTRIFHQGAAFYAQTTLDTIEPRFRQLLERIMAELADDDSLKQETLDAVSAGLEQYVSAVDEVISARNKAALARTHCDSVRTKWEEEITRVYAALLVQIGKKAANRIFPKTKRRNQKQKNTPQVSISAPLLSP